jgi:hypothetical protein
LRVLVAVLALSPLASGAEPGPLLAKIKAVGKQGAGNVEASQALQELVHRGPAVLLDILTAFDDADPVAANWLRVAVDTIADREVVAGRPLPAVKLEAFVEDRRHNSAARRLAYEWLVRADVTAPQRLLPGMLNDPGQELRRNAVEVAFADAQKLLDTDKVVARDALQKSFIAARDLDQVQEIAAKLVDLDVYVNLAAHLGFIQRWQVVGPFDNRGGKGFTAIFPPEEGVDLGMTYAGKDGTQVGWRDFRTAGAPGRVVPATLAKVDLNAIIGRHKGAVAYAFAVVESPTEQGVELRAASPNGIKLFLNGTGICACEDYHRNARLDTHIGRGLLKAGRNEILVKVCQNEQQDAWAQDWVFQLRVCDAIGGAVPLTVWPATPQTVPPERAVGRSGWPLGGGLVVSGLVAAWLWRRRTRSLFTFRVHEA